MAEPVKQEEPISPLAPADAKQRPVSTDSGAISHTASEEAMNRLSLQEYDILPPSGLQQRGLLLFPEDVEGDDGLHNPETKSTKQPRNCSRFSRRVMINVGVLTIILVGLIVFFLVYYIT